MLELDEKALEAEEDELDSLYYLKTSFTDACSGFGDITMNNYLWQNNRRHNWRLFVLPMRQML